MQLSCVPYTGQATSARPCIIGYAPFSPFTDVAPDSSGASVAAGLHKYALGPLQPGGKAYGSSSSASRLVLHNAMPLDWRRLLRDHIEHSLETPTVQFELRPSGRPGTLPLAPGQLLSKVRAGQQQQGSPAKLQQAQQQTPAMPPSPPQPTPPAPLLPAPPTPPPQQAAAPAAHPPLPPVPPPASALQPMPAQDPMPPMPPMPPMHRSAMQVRDTVEARTQGNTTSKHQQPRAHFICRRMLVMLAASPYPQSIATTAAPALAVARPCLLHQACHDVAACCRR